MQDPILDEIPRVSTSCETMVCSATAAITAVRISQWLDADGDSVSGVLKGAVMSSSAETTRSFPRVPKTLSLVKTVPYPTRKIKNGASLCSDSASCP